MSTSSPGLAFRPDIQGLRAVAVGLVVLAHAGAPGFAGGFIGVDVFFVLSGYLITGLLVQERMTTGHVRYLEFLARRLRRLLPAMLTMLVLVLLLGTVLLTAFEMRMQARSFPYAVAWISNFFFAFAERDYFQALQDYDLFLHTWSLGVEEQFYLMWPWLVLVLVGMGGRNADRAALGRTMVAALGIIAVASFAICLLMTDMIAILAFYMMPARIWQFALGALVFAGLHIASTSDRDNALPQHARWALPAGLIGAVLVVGSAMLLGDDISYPGWYALAPSVGAALLIAGGTVSRRNAVSAVLETKPMVWVGDRSYSIYLWHWPFLVIGGSLGVTRSAAGAVAVVLLSIVVAALSYRLVEYPLWKGRFRTAAARKVIIAAFAAIAISAVGFNLLKTRVFGAEAALQAAQGYDPRQDADARIYSATKTCDTGHFGAEILPCAIGDRNGDKLAVLIGDSVGTQWTPMLSGVFAAPDWQVLVLTKSACAIVDKTWYYEKAGGDYVVCTEWRNKVLDYVAQLAPDVIVLGSSSFYKFDRDDWVQGTARILERAAPAAGQVVIISGTPRLSFDGPSCLEDPWRFSFRLIDGDRECEEARTEPQPDEVAGYLREAAAGFANAQVLDLNDLVCTADRCAAATPDGIAVFRDDDHLTATFALSVVEEAKRRLATLGVSPSEPESGSSPP